MNPIRTANRFTDSIRPGISVSIPLDQVQGRLFEVLKPKGYQAELLDTGAF